MMKSSNRLRVRGYGWQKDLPEQRNFSYAAPSPSPAPLPAKVDLRSQP